MRPLARSALLGALTTLLAAGPTLAQGAPAAPTAATAAEAARDSLLARADRGRFLGNKDAPLLIYVFSDFQCPFCHEFETGTFPQVDSAYVKTGKAQVVFFNFPLNIHPNAWVGAEAAMCAGAQGKFWEMHDSLFIEQKAWSTSNDPQAYFDRYATALGLDPGAFRDCTGGDRVATLLIRDLTIGASGGVRGTPTIVLIRKEGEGGKPEAGQKVLTGAVPFPDFQKAVEELMGDDAGNQPGN